MAEIKADFLSRQKSLAYSLRIFVDNFSLLSPLQRLLSNSCKTRRNTAKDEQKYQPIFLLVFSGSRVTKSQVY